MNQKQLQDYHNLFNVCEKIFLRAKKLYGIKMARRRTLSFLLGAKTNNTCAESSEIFQKLIYEYSFKGRKKDHEKKTFKKDNLRYQFVIYQAKNLIKLMKNYIHSVENEENTIKQKFAVDMLNNMLKVYDMTDELPDETKQIIQNFF